jgi:hypothetical protein
MSDLQNPKALSDAEFAASHGSTLHSNMLRNRFVIYATNWGIVRKMEVWLAGNCTGLYHLSNKYQSPMMLYIERKKDAALFKMFFEVMEDGDSNE